MSKERLNDEREDRHEEYLEVEREHRRFVKDEKVAKVGDGVVVRRMAHQRSM